MIFNKPEEFYRDIDALSHSSLKHLDIDCGGGPELFMAMKKKELQPKESKALNIGKAFDRYLLTPSEFENDFFIADLNPPTGLLADLTKRVGNQIYEANKIGLGVSVEDIFNQCFPDSGFKQKIDTVWANFNKDDNKNYLDNVIKAKSRILIGQKELENLKKAFESIKTHKYWCEYFEKKTFSQVITFTDDFLSSGEAYKGLIDSMYINYDKKEVIIPDLKTTSKNILDFKWSFANLKYYRQSTGYKGCLMGESDTNEIKHEYIIPSGFTIKPMICAIELEYPYRAKAIEIDLNQQFIATGELVTLINRFKWHRDNNNWTYSKEYHEDNLIVDTYDLNDYFKEKQIINEY